MNEINTINNGRQNVAQVGVTQANKAAALKAVAIDSEESDNLEISQVVTVLGSALQAQNDEERQFFVDDELDKMVVQVINSDTRELVRQIPTEEAIMLSKKLQDIMALMA